MKSSKLIMSLVIAGLMAVVPCGSVSATPSIVGVPDQKIDIGEPPEMPEIPEIPGTIEGYEGDYLSVIDVATGQFFTDEIVLQPHRIYAMHVYLHNSSAQSDYAVMRYDYPEQLQIAERYDLSLKISGHRCSYMDTIKLSTGDNLTLLPINKTQVDRWPAADGVAFGRTHLAIGKDNTMAIVDDIQSGSTVEITLFFQTVAIGAEPIEIGRDETDEIIDSIPILGDVMEAVGVPLLCPTEVAGTEVLQIGDAIVGLPFIAKRADWQWASPEAHRKG